MALTGFSTGALAFADFGSALCLLKGTSMKAVELSALRLAELPVLIEALPRLNLEQFEYVSFHAPSRFSVEEEVDVIDLLYRVPNEIPIIVHPDTIHDSEKWAQFGDQLAIENMDRRKPDGRTSDELSHWFERLPAAQLCFDLAHAHHCDRTMTEAFRILSRFQDRICQLHISELDSTGRHFSLSSGTVQAYLEVADLIPADSPAILESRIPICEWDHGMHRAWIERESGLANKAIGREPSAAAGRIMSMGNLIHPAQALG
jgi:sugar phosphate isomerase/epimerase